MSQKSHAIKRVIKEPYSGRPLSTSDYDMTEEVLGVAADSSSAVIGITERSDAVIRGLKLIVEHHGGPSRVRSELSRQLHAYLDTSSAEGVWLKRMKYVLTYPLAKYLRNDLPASPDEVFSPSGYLRRWMKARMNAFNRKNTHLWYSWLQAKRCALSVSDAMVAEAYEKHFNQLSKPDPCLPGGAGSSMFEKIMSNPTFRTVLNRIRDEIRETYVNDFTEWTPSTSACFEGSRSKGGQQGAVAEYANCFESRTMNLDFAETISGEYLDQVMENEPYVTKSRTSCYNIGGDELVRMYQLTTVRGGNVERRIAEQYERSGRYRWKKLFSVRDHFFRNQKRCDATIQAVLEPLKIRIISKGSAMHYYAMKPLQKRIHSVMRKMSCFRLIGRPICPTDLIDLLPQREVREGDQWISVDYSAATDGLSSRLGLAILSHITRDIPIEDQIMAGRVLGRHYLHYPEFKNGKWGDAKFRGKQRNGQLMGGILSFPILCLANLAVYLMVKDIQVTKWKDVRQELDRVLVNGDDMLYVGTDEDWKNHIEISGQVGLEMSVGKAYKHRSYANANSTSFICDLDKVTVDYTRMMEQSEDLSDRFYHIAHPWQINYLNAGLVFGQHKVQAREYGTAESHHADSTSVVANIPTILDGCLPGTQSKMLEHILKFRRDDIKSDTKAVLIGSRGKRTETYRNLFLPVHLGGMGVNPPVGWKFHIKKIDRRIAGSLTDPQYSSLPLPGYELSKEIDPIPPWIRKNVEPIPVEIRLCHKRIRHVPVGHHAPWWYNRQARLY